MRSRAIILLAFISIICSAQWQVLPSNTTADLSEIRFVNADTGFTCGHNGTLLETFNAGSTWLTLNALSADYDFIEALDHDTIFLAGEDGLYRTLNNGQTWQHFLDGTPLFDLAYSDAGYLFVKKSSADSCNFAGYWIKITVYRNYHSNDLGNSFGLNQGVQNSWGQKQFLKNGIGFDLSGIRFFNGTFEHCYDMDLGNVYRSYDGGLTWQPDDYNGGYFDARLYPGWFLNDTLGYVERNSLYGEVGFIFKTTDGALSFSQIPLVNIAHLTDLVFINEFEGYALKDNKIYKLSYLNDRFAVQLDYSSDRQLKDITISPENKAYVVGDNGIILTKQLDPASGPDTLYLVSPDKDQIQFVNTTVGASHIEEFKIAANGNMPVSVDLGSNEIFKIRLEGSNTFADTIPAFILQPSQETIVQVLFTPADYIEYSHDLAIHTDAFGDTVMFVHLMGTGTMDLYGTISEDMVLCAPYISVLGNIIVTDSATVTICPGTTLAFNGPYSIAVAGALNAAGTPENKIVFTAAEGNEGWQGLRFSGSENTDSTILSYCVIEYSNYLDQESRDYTGAISVSNHERFVLKNCEIKNNWNYYSFISSLYVTDSKVIIENNKFHHNRTDYEGHTIEIESSRGLMKNNIIYSNDELAMEFKYVGNEFILLQNLIINNNGRDDDEGTSAIRIFTSSPQIILNTICNNYSDSQGQALYLENTSNPLIEGNLIYGNEHNQIDAFPGNSPIVRYNDIEGGWENGEFNIDSDPGFINPSPQKILIDDYLDYDFRFTANSPCYNKGSNQTPNLPENDLEGLPRICGGITDIGAYEAHFWDQLGPVNACIGDSITFTITPIAPPPYMFSWKHNGQLLSSVTGNQLILDNIDENDEGLYECNVITSLDTVFTRGILTILNAPDLIAQPPDISSCHGDTLFATVDAEGKDLSYEWINYDNGNVEALTDTFFVNTQTSFSGQYFCRISNICGMVETVPFSVDVWPGYELELGNDTVLGQNSSLVLDAGAGASSYLWSTGETTRFLTVNGSDYNIGGHEFSVSVVYSEHDCESWDNIHIMIIDDSWINESENEIVNIFPNPSSGVVFCSFKKEFREEKASYFIHDLSGRLVCQGETKIPDGGKMQLPQDCLEHGIYFIHFITDAYSVTRKVIILK